MLKKNIGVVLALFVFAFSSLGLIARPIENEKGKSDEELRKVSQVYDLQVNTVSNIQFYTTNYGIFGLDVARNRGGGFWPRGSQNQYIFAGGVWLAAIKQRPGDTNNTTRKYCSITYNPNNGRSWMAPGRMDPNSTAKDIADNNEITKYRTYFSTDFKAGDGSAISSDDGENWPIWDITPGDTLKVDRYFGKYIDDPLARSRTTYPKGPAFISGEDIFSTYKDTDLGLYDGGATQRKNLGYPLRLQFEQMIYSWGFGDYRDFIFLKYEITNYSKDTLQQCWMAPVMDVDIAVATNSQNGAANDRCRYYEEDPSLNLAVQWSMTDQGERGQGFGYLGFDFLESPAVYTVNLPKKITSSTNGNVTTYDIKEYMILKDTIVVVPVWGDSTIVGTRDSLVVLADTLVKHSTMAITDNSGKLDTVVKTVFNITENIRRDKKFYENSEQLGLQTFRNWPIAEDKNGDDERYNFMSSRSRDGDIGQGDKRFMMATGPFNMLPGDTARVVVGMILATPAARLEADGSTADIAELIKKDKFAQSVYDNNFRAPQPPDRAIIKKWTPLNNGIQIEFDSTSEMSVDDLEMGLAFMGYRLYRARRTDVDTFNVDVITKTAADDQNKTKGPLGWKQIATWNLPTPCYKSVYRAGRNDLKDASIHYIDSLRIVGPAYNDDGTIDSTSICVMRVGRGVKLFSDSVVKACNFFGNVNGLFGRQPFRGAAIPVIAFIDTAIISAPWGKHYGELVPRDGGPIYYNPYKPSSNTNKLFSELIGTVKLDQAQIAYNPLLTQTQTINISALDTALLPTKVGDTLYLKNTYRTAIINNKKQLLVDRVVPLDSADVNKAMLDTFKIKSILDQVYNWIKIGHAKVKFSKFEQSEEIRKNVIAPYMSLITNGRVFTDLGDDNGDGYVTTDINPLKTEKLINSVDYYYRLLAYDEGAFDQPTPGKKNDGPEGLSNFVKTHPAASPAGNQSQFTVTYVDSARIGGLYNFKFYGTNQDRVNQLLAGHELELEFTPYWDLTMLSLPTEPGNPPKNLTFGMYYRNVNVKDLTTGKPVFSGRTVFEADPCSWAYRGGFTENAISWYLSDTAIVDSVHPERSTTFPLFHNNEVFQRTGYFTTGDFRQFGYCYSLPFLEPVQNTFGFSFNFSLQQWGGALRPDSASKRTTIGMTPYYPLADTNFIFTTNRTGFTTTGQDLFYQANCSYAIGTSFGQTTYGSYNNGGGDFVVTFQPGGTEDMTLTFGKTGAKRTNTFKVPYLTATVINTKKYNRPNEFGDSSVVKYNVPIEHMDLPIDTLYDRKGSPNVQMLGQRNDEFIGKFNISGMPWVNSRGQNSILRIGEQRALPSDFKGTLTRVTVGTQGRYYLSAISTDGKDTLDFTNQITIAGCSFLFDYANKVRFERDQKLWDWIPTDQYVYGNDYKAGDTVTLKISGGAYGLPMPGAKVRVKVSGSETAPNEYTKEMLDKVTVVPNPYFISHQMQSSPYDAKLYFTRLPKTCTISIYTVAGDLVQEINHDETNSSDPTKHGIDVWNLLSSNQQRVQSQTFIAVIKAANGVESVVQFSVVVGGFRLIPENN